MLSENYKAKTGNNLFISHTGRDLLGPAFHAKDLLRFSQNGTITVFDCPCLVEISIANHVYDFNMHHAHDFYIFFVNHAQDRRKNGTK